MTREMSLGLFKGMSNVLAFLTIIPVRMNSSSIADAASYMYLFPLVGAFVGLMAGLSAFLLYHIFPSLIVGFLALAAILFITGLHHTDGLLDFGDGIMRRGPPEEKIRIMHEQRTGAGALALGLVVLSTTAFAIGYLSRGNVLQSLVVSEASAKLAMVLAAWYGKSAHEGVNTFFINAMHRRNGESRLLTALALSFGIAMLLLGVVGLIAILAASFTSLILDYVSNRHFGGLTGDVFGAINDLARLASLLAILAVVKWV